VISHPKWPGYCKIGKAHDVKARLRTYQTADPFRQFKLVAAVRFSSRHAAEGRVMEELAAVRVGRTEWFRLHPTDARLMIDRAKEKHD